MKKVKKEEPKTKTMKHAKKEPGELELLKAELKALKEENKQLREENKEAQEIKEENNFLKKIYIRKRFMCEIVAENEEFKKNQSLLAIRYGAYTDDLVELEKRYGYEKLNKYFRIISHELQEAKREEAEKEKEENENAGVN